MKVGRRLSKALELDQCEDRSLLTLIFVLNGNAYDAAMPSILTANAAQILEAAGHQVVQLSTPTLAAPDALSRVARQIGTFSHGQPIGLVGFSAGGTLAVHLAGIVSLHVAATLDYYGPPDLRDYLRFHRGDHVYRYVVGHAPFARAAIRQLSGPVVTSAHMVAAFGLADRNVVASPSATSFLRDFPQGHVYYYPGGHGVSILASSPALEDFLEHLGVTPT